MADRTAKVIFGTNHIFELDACPGPLFWTSRLHVDVDGHPRCYHPQGSPPGLDHLTNAGKPGKWWGIATDKSGKPYVQGPEHPAPGFHVSTTALEDNNLPASHPGRYVHSGEVPYFVLPSKPKFAPNQALGDLALLFNIVSGKKSWAIYADIGPATQIGEGSMKLNENLGLSSNPKNGGTEKEIIATVFFPGSKIGWPRPQAELAEATQRLFDGWGGMASLKIGLSHLDWSKFA